MTFLFWNLYRKPLDRELANLAWHHEVDVLMLAECLLPPARILKALNRQRADYFFAPGLYERIRIFTRFPSEFIRPSFEKERLKWKTKRSRILRSSSHAFQAKSVGARDGKPLA